MKFAIVMEILTDEFQKVVTLGQVIALNVYIILMDHNVSIVWKAFSVMLKLEHVRGFLNL